MSRITDWHGKTRVWTVTDVERVEPDSTLFEIPKEYLPHHDPLLKQRQSLSKTEPEMRR